MTAACFPVNLGEWFGCRFYHLSLFEIHTRLSPPRCKFAASRRKGRYKARWRKSSHLSKVNRCEKTNHAVPDLESKAGETAHGAAPGSGKASPKLVGQG
jgi:hypothetical protein